MNQSEASAAIKSENWKKSLLSRLKKSRHDDQKAPDIDLDIPEQNRYCTDLIGIVLLISLLFGLVCLVIYCMNYGDVYRVGNGVDSCGYVCGRRSSTNEDPTLRNPLEGRSNEYGLICTPDNEYKKLLLFHKSDSVLTNVEHLLKSCVSECYDGFETIGNKCLPTVGTDVANTIFSIIGHEHFFKEITEDLYYTWSFVVGLACLTTALSLIGLIIIRSFALPTIWLILLGLLLNAFGASVFSWIRWYDLNQEEHPSDAHKKLYHTYLIGALSSSATSVNVGLLVFSLRKRVKLVAELYREAGRAIREMPQLFFAPFFTFCALCSVSAMWLYFSIWIESAGHLTLEGGSSFYRKDVVMHITRWFNILMVMWLITFIVGCQDMVVACTIIQWYFIRNKSKLKKPIRRSSYYLFRYHLGSVALFTMCTSTFRLLRAAFKKFDFAFLSPNNQYIRPLFMCCDCCILLFERYLALMSRNAFIEMSMHGKNFLTSGKEAFLLVVHNRWTMQAISSTGDHVLLFLKFLAVLPSIIIGAFILQDIRGLNHMWVMLLLTAFLAFSISHCFISVVQMVIDSIFICYCYDIKWNDGDKRPYFMTMSLLAFVEKSVLVAEKESLLDMEFAEP